MSATRSVCCGNSTDRGPALDHDLTNAPCRRAFRRRGFTLVELLWSMTLSLIVMAAVASLFGVFSRSLTQAQAAADLAARMRTGAWRLRQDLSGVTVDLMPPARPEAESGYFEYFEGWRKDAHAVHGRGGQMLVADVDDVLMFTTRSEGQPFVGRYGGQTIESPVTEVAWFCRPSSVQPVAGMTLFTLYRRQELVMPYVGRAPFAGSNAAPTTFDTNLHDLSVRSEGGRFVPNSLGDLTKRENRFLRGGTTAFPHAWASDQVVMSGTVSGTYQLAGAGAPLSGVRAGEDVVLANVVSFDVRVYDPDVRSPLTSVVHVPCQTTAGSASVTLNVNGNCMDPLLLYPDKAGSRLSGVIQLGAQIRPGVAFPSGATFTEDDPQGGTNWGSWIMNVSGAAATSGTTILAVESGTCLPGDGRYFDATSGTGARGGYVDLGWGGIFQAAALQYGPPRFRNDFAGDPPRVLVDRGSFQPPTALSVAATFPPAGQTAFRTGGLRVRPGGATTPLENGSSRTYDTWSTHFESNGRDDDGDGFVDEGTNGIDDSNPPDGVPDDPAEAETSAPYPVRLRGLQVVIRCYEPDSGQIRQTTVRHTFLAR